MPLLADRRRGQHPLARGRVPSEQDLKRLEKAVSRVLVAAATPVDKRVNGVSARSYQLHQQWQDQSLTFYDLSGVCSTAADFYGKAFSNLRFFPARKNAKGEITEITDEADVLELWQRIRDRSGGMSWIQRSYGRLQFLVGDGYLTVSGDSDSEDELWEYLSPTELRWEGDRFVRSPAPGLRETDEALPPDVPLARPVPDNVRRAWRMYQPHPKHSMLAHSSMQPVLDDFEELVLLTAAVRARVKSRLASAGILLVPEEVSFADEDGGDEDPDRDIFLERLMAHMTTPIMQEGAASAVVPFVVRVAMQYIEGFKHIKTHDPNETYRETGLRMETIKRIGISIDLPPEMLLGMGDLNHWVGWLIDEQFAKSHIYPGADMFALDLASAYLRPVCKEEAVRDWQAITVGYDPTRLVVHPDRSQNAKDLFSVGEIGGTTLRKATGFTEDDAPTQEERDRFLAIKLRSADLLDEQPENQPTPETEQTGSGASETPPSSETAPNTQPTMSSLATRLLGAAEFSITRARSLAGSRIRPKIRNCEDCLMLANDVPNHRLAAVLGAQIITDIGETPSKLVKGAGSEFIQTAQRWDIPTPTASIMADAIEVFAARTLFELDPDPLPAGFDLYVSEVT